MSDQREEPPHTVRLFPDYAGTGLWFGGPIGDELTGLTSGLIGDLRGREQSYYDSLTPDLDWISADMARQFSRAGNRLGQRVADELGNGYSIEFATYEDSVPARRFRAVGPAATARAAAAFGALVCARKTQEDEIGGTRRRPAMARPPFGLPTHRFRQPVSGRRRLARTRTRNSIRPADRGPVHPS